MHMQDLIEVTTNNIQPDSREDEFFAMKAFAKWLFYMNKYHEELRCDTIDEEYSVFLNEMIRYITERISTTNGDHPDLRKYELALHNFNNQQGYFVF